MAVAVQEPSRLRWPDLTIMVLAVSLAVAGVVVSGSARVFTEAVNARGLLPGGIVRSFVHLGLGLLVMVLAMLPDYRRFARGGLAWTMLIGICFLLVLALVSPAVGNTHRWIHIGRFSLQPSEPAKAVLVLLVAATIAHADREIETVRGLVRPLAVAGAIAGLVLVGKDLGTPVLMFLTTIILCLAAGARFKHVGTLLGAGLLGGIAAVILEPYRVGRVMGFTKALGFSPEGMSEIPYQLRQSLLAIGSGGVAGKGFGASTQKAFFLPEADNDFIFAVIAEELGLFVALALIAAFLVLAWRGLKVADDAQDELGRLIAIGATWMLSGQALCHMGVVAGILPTKGLTLPFFSTGGWSLIVSCAMAGLLLNVSLRRRPYGC